MAICKCSSRCSLFKIAHLRIHLSVVNYSRHFSTAWCIKTLNCLRARFVYMSMSVEVHDLQVRRSENSTCLQTHDTFDFGAATYCRELTGPAKERLWCTAPVYKLAFLQQHPQGTKSVGALMEMLITLFCAAFRYKNKCRLVRIFGFFSCSLFLVLRTKRQSRRLHRNKGTAAIL